jgi:hypothetical protein
MQSATTPGSVAPGSAAEGGAEDEATGAVVPGAVGTGVDAADVGGESGAGAAAEVVTAGVAEVEGTGAVPAGALLLLLAVQAAVRRRSPSVEYMAGFLSSSRITYLRCANRLKGCASIAAGALRGQFVAGTLHVP